MRSVPAKGSVSAQQSAELRDASQEQPLVEQVRGYLQEGRERPSPVLLSPEGLEGWSHRSLKQQFLEAGNSRRNKFPFATQPVPSPGG